MKSKMTINECGDKFWKLPSGDLHREDGPAIEYNDGSKYWYLKGILYSEELFISEIRSVKLKKLL